jgi:hypothetical protein
MPSPPSPAHRNPRLRDNQPHGGPGDDADQDKMAGGDSHNSDDTETDEKTGTTTSLDSPRERITVDE